MSPRGAPMASDFVKRKVLLLGDGGVGKTSLIRRFVVDKFSDDYIVTIGTKITKKDLRIDTGARTVDLSLMIWDVLGQRGYRGIQASSFDGARGVLFVYDLTRPETQDSLATYWLPRLRAVAGDVPRVVVGNKVDLLEDRGGAVRDAEEFAPTIGATAFASSAKTGENVEAAFLALGREVLAKSDARAVAPVAVDIENDGPLTLIGAVDRIILDFCRTFGDSEAGMPLARQQLVRAGLDITAPTRDGVALALEYLAEVEAGFRNADEVEANKVRRMAWVREASAS